MALLTQMTLLSEMALLSRTIRASPPAIQRVVRLDALFGTCTDTEKFIPHGGAPPQSLIVLLFQGQPRRRGLHCGINSGDLRRIATQPLRTARCNMMRLDALFGTGTDTAEFTPSGGPRAQPPRRLALIRAPSSSRLHRSIFGCDLHRMPAQSTLDGPGRRRIRHRHREAHTSW